MDKPYFWLGEEAEFVMDCDAEYLETYEITGNQFIDGPIYFEIDHDD